MTPANEHIARVLADTNEVWPTEVVFQERKETATVAQPVAYANPVILLPDATGEEDWTAKVQGHRDDVFRLPLFAQPCASQNASDFKALYEKSQELFARERGITKELAAALQSFIAEFGDKSTSATVRAGRAALCKVQHVAARGAEVSE